MIDNYIDRIKRFNVKSIVLFGSVARNDAKEQSDVDILVITLGLPDITERCDFVTVKKPSRIEDIWMTPDELAEMVDAKTGFVVDALLEGGDITGRWDGQRCEKSADRLFEATECKEVETRLVYTAGRFEDGNIV